MSKKAFLVDFSFTVRVITEDTISQTSLIEAAAKKLREEVIDSPIGDNVVEIEEDTEDPYDPETE